MKLNVLPLFDGISCGRIALERAGVPLDNYFASEIDKFAIQVSRINWPDIKHIGDVCNITLNSKRLNNETFVINYKIDLLIAGSPCQGFSNNGNMENFEHKGSKLFYEFLRILKEARVINPNVLFLLENVKMKGVWRDKITEYLGVQPILIDSCLVSAQKRRRYYWTNIPNIEQPADLNINIDKILLNGEAILRWQNKNTGAVIDYNKAATLRASPGTDIKKKQRVVLDIEDEFLIIKEATKKGFVKVKTGQIFDAQFPESKTRRGRLMADKSNCLTTSIDWQLYLSKGKTRPILPIEAERLQNVKDNYTESVSSTQRFKLLGNGWETNTIAHIFKNIPL